MKNVSQNYNQQRWRDLREQILQRDGYEDQITKRFGKRKPAEIVHHVFPADEFPEYFWQGWNLISISGQTHETLHNRDTQELTLEGVKLLRRIARKYNVEIPLRYREDPERRANPFHRRRPHRIQDYYREDR